MHSHAGRRYSQVPCVDHGFLHLPLLDGRLCFGILSNPISVSDTRLLVSYVNSILTIDNSMACKTLGGKGLTQSDRGILTSTPMRCTKYFIVTEQVVDSKEGEKQTTDRYQV